MKAQTPFLSLTRPVVLDSEGQKPWSHVIRFSPSLCPWKSTLSSTFLLPSSVVISHCLSTCPKAFRIRLLHRQFVPFLSINHCFSTSWFYRPWNSQCFSVCHVGVLTRAGMPNTSAGQQATSPTQPGHLSPSLWAGRQPAAWESHMLRKNKGPIVWERTLQMWGQ